MAEISELPEMSDRSIRASTDNNLGSPFSHCEDSSLLFRASATFMNSLYSEAPILSEQLQL